MARTWYLVHCKPQQQSRAELNLVQQGFEIYSPQHPVKKLVRGKGESREEVQEHATRSLWRYNR